MATSGAQTPSSGRQARFIALALGLPIVLLLVTLMAMPFLAQDETRLQAIGPVPPEQGAEQGGVRFDGTVHVWDVVGSVTLDDQRNARVRFNLRGPDSHPPSMMMDIPVWFDLLEGGAAPVEVAAEQTGVGAFVAEARLPAPGTWLMRMTIGDVTGVLRLQVDE